MFHQELLLNLLKRARVSKENKRELSVRVFENGQSFLRNGVNRVSKNFFCDRVNRAHGTCLFRSFDPKSLFVYKIDYRSEKIIQCQYFSLLSTDIGKLKKKWCHVFVVVRTVQVNFIISKLTSKRIL